MINLDFLQGGRTTRRYHGLPMLDYQRVDAHSYGVAQLVRLLAKDYNCDDKMLAKLLCAALDHDLAEHITGDMPAPSKRHLGIRKEVGEWENNLLYKAGFSDALPNMDKQEERILKLADAAEGCLHCIEERRMGNAHPRLIATFHAFWGYCTEEQNMGGPSEGENEKHLRQWMISAWRAANGGKW